MTNEVESYFNKLKSIAKNAKTIKTLKFVVRECKILTKKYKNIIPIRQLNSYYNVISDIVSKRIRELK